MMQLFFINYFNNLQELHDEIRNAVQGLPQNALDWTFGSGMNSINVLVVHLIGAERYWISDVIAGVPSNRDRDSEFMVQGLSENELLNRLDDIESYVKKILEVMTLQNLEESRISPRNGREVTVGWALCHILKHTSLHLGHIQITRQLWDQIQNL